MTTATDAALAQLSLGAYSNTPVALPAGFTPAATLPVTLGAGESFAGGLYQSDNSAALVTEGVVNGQESLVIAFRGSDDQQDSLNDLQNINADYADFTSLFQAVDQVRWFTLGEPGTPLAHEDTVTAAMCRAVGRPERTVPHRVRAAQSARLAP